MHAHGPEARLAAGCLAFAVLCLASSQPCRADEPQEDLSLHAQATYVPQYKPSFPALYTGPHSLGPEAAHAYSFSTTLFAGARLGPDLEGYADLEGTQGFPFSNQTGLGGFSNGELAKTAGTEIKWYRARLFVRGTFGYGGGGETIPADQNQLAGTVDRRRLVVTAGNLSIADVFDDNAYAHDPREDFLNSAVISSGAYDYAADTRGYTWGIVAEWHEPEWSLRAARFAEPEEPNGQTLDSRMFQHYGDQVELERSLAMRGREGKLRVLAFRNVAVMGRYRDALHLGEDQGQSPDVSLVRRRNVKWGLALNVEQEIAPELGFFARASWSDGQTETYSFAEIDRSIAFGASLGGGRWGRPDDRLGVALAWNGLSCAHRDYLAAGGLGYFLGDGRLSYGPERIVEAYYRIVVLKGIELSIDAQRIANPGYNRDRGPARFYGLRLHAEL
ncbi:MAG TPA: carbohydrate porin [Usitatibacter sp.]|nr:carbohydrate porin [Usitatibacter sp.]